MTEGIARLSTRFLEHMVICADGYRASGDFDAFTQEKCQRFIKSKTFSNICETLGTHPDYVIKKIRAKQTRRKDGELN